MKFGVLSLRRSFRFKVASVALVTTVAALLAAFLLLLIQGWSAERDKLVRSRGAVAHVLAYNLSQSLVFEDKVGAQIRLESVRDASGLRSALVFDKDGALFAQMGRKAADIDPIHGAAKLSPIWRYTPTTLEYRVPVVVERERVGELVMVSDLDELWILVRNYLAVAGLSFTLATGVALITGFWLARIIIEPVSKLARAMDRVRHSGEFEHAVDKSSDDEVGLLTDSFNDLLGELKRNDQSLREAFDDLTKARDQAQEASIQKSQFLANMSHEIRTPLNGVLGMAQAMEMDDLPPRQGERLSVIRSSGEMLLAVLNDILDISKIEAGKLELETVEFDLVDLVESVRAIYAPVAVSKGLHLTIAMESASGAWLGDPTRLRQILSNLISNALKFTTKGGVTVIVEADDLGLHIHVKDTGIGIPPAKLGQLFGKFVQVDSSTTRRFGGTGLGLAICRELALLMGGDIEAQSVDGEGSCFTANLPLVRQAISEQAATPAARQISGVDAQDPGRSLRVLAADDNPTNRQVLEALLGPLEVELTQVENGREAVESWRIGNFDLILMDIQMPEMDGIQATLAIRSEEARDGRPPIPIFALSANAMAHQVKQYLAVGMSGHIAKPIDVSRLYEALGGVELLDQVA